MSSCDVVRLVCVIVLNRDYSIDVERRSSVAGGDDAVEGTVYRKHEWESTTKKASNRSWDKVYLTLRQGELAAYKVCHFVVCISVLVKSAVVIWTDCSFPQDQKSARATPDAHYRNESPLDIRTATAEVAADYTKKRHAFRLK